MSGNHFGRTTGLEKTVDDRISKEVRDLMHRGDNMVTRVLSAYADRKKHCSIQILQQGTVL
jgi:hypothetical protein